MSKNSKGMFSLLSAFLLLATSCASTYHPINPSRLNYTSYAEGADIDFSYKYNVMSLRNNKKYYKKENKKHIQVVAINITNNTDRDINYNDLDFYMGKREVNPLESEYVYSQLKQGVPIYLLYLLLTPLKLYTYNGNGTVNETPIGFGLGPGLTLGNMATAGSANARFKDELQMHDLTNRVIKPGETVYGLVSFFGISFDPIEVKLPSAPSQKPVTSK